MHEWLMKCMHTEAPASENLSQAGFATINIYWTTRIGTPACPSLLSYSYRTAAASASAEDWAWQRRPEKE
eukprot:scaffold210691_cov47-Prasinocladus_malaysianus.AAC.1